MGGVGATVVVVSLITGRGYGTIEFCPLVAVDVVVVGMYGLVAMGIPGLLTDMVVEGM